MRIKEFIGNIYLEYLPNNLRLERIWKLAQVDFKKRYYNDKFGLLWALINPLTQITIYYFVFTKIFQRGGAIPNFEFYLFCALIIWIAFSEATNLGMRILYTKRYLIENIQFNWVDLYFTHIISVSLGMCFNFFAYALGLVVLGVSVGTYWYLFPIVLITWACYSFSLSMILSILRPIFDDIVHIWKILIMIGFWISGIFFPADELLQEYPLLGYFNPFLGLILNTRACVLENNPIFFDLLILNLSGGIFLVLLGLLIFKKFSKKIIEKL